MEPLGHGWLLQRILGVWAASCAKLTPKHFRSRGAGGMCWNLSWFSLVVHFKQAIFLHQWCGFLGQVFEVVCHFAVRRSKHVQVEDLLRHGGTSRAKQKSKYHQKALAYHLASSVVLPKSPPPGDGPDMPITSLQVLLAWETLHAPTGPQKCGFEDRCIQVHRVSPELCPLARSSCYFKILESAASILYQRDRHLLLSGGVRSIGISEDQNKSKTLCLSLCLSLSLSLPLSVCLALSVLLSLSLSISVFLSLSLSISLSVSLSLSCSLPLSFYLCLALSLPLSLSLAPALARYLPFG